MIGSDGQLGIMTTEGMGAATAMLDAALARYPPKMCKYVADNKQEILLAAMCKSSRIKAGRVRTCGTVDIGCSQTAESCHMIFNRYTQNVIDKNGIVANIDAVQDYLKSQRLAGESVRMGARTDLHMKPLYKDILGVDGRNRRLGLPQNVKGVTMRMLAGPDGVVGTAQLNTKCNSAKGASTSNDTDQGMGQSLDRTTRIKSTTELLAQRPRWVTALIDFLGDVNDSALARAYALVPDVQQNTAGNAFSVPSESNTEMLYNVRNKKNFAAMECGCKYASMKPTVLCHHKLAAILAFVK